MNLHRYLPITFFAFFGVLPILAQDGPCTKDSRPDCARAVEFFHHVQTLLRTNDRQALAAIIEYPLLTNVSHKKSRIATRAEFLSHFDEIFDDGVHCEALKASDKDVWGSWRGYTVGGGAIWFDSVIPRGEHANTNAPDFWTKYPFKIKAINNEAYDPCQSPVGVHGKSPRG
jgi:hypothetical protein